MAYFLNRLNFQVLNITPSLQINVSLPLVSKCSKWQGVRNVLHVMCELILVTWKIIMIKNANMHKKHVKDIIKERMHVVSMLLH
jgi:hypothetical protein